MSFTLPKRVEGADETILDQLDWNKLSAYARAQELAGEPSYMTVVIEVEMNSDWQRAIVARFAQLIEQGDERNDATDRESYRITATWNATLDTQAGSYAIPPEPIEAPDAVAMPPVIAGAHARAMRVRQAVIDQLRSEFAHDELLESLLGIILVSQKTAALVTGLDVSTLSKFATQGRGPLIWATEGSRVPRYRLVDVIEWSLGGEL